MRAGSARCSRVPAVLRDRTSGSCEFADCTVRYHSYPVYASDAIRLSQWSLSADDIHAHLSRPAVVCSCAQQFTQACRPQRLRQISRPCCQSPNQVFKRCRAPGPISSRRRALPAAKRLACGLVQTLHGRETQQAHSRVGRARNVPDKLLVRGDFLSRAVCE